MRRSVIMFLVVRVGVKGCSVTGSGVTGVTVAMLLGGGAKGR